jgi:RNA polymerase sigma factor (sigma-70 family)
VAPQPAPVTDISDADVTVAGEAVHRFLSARLRDRHVVEDVCQEAIARLLQARDRLDSSSATPYAITVAKSILIGDARKADVAKRHIHRLDRGTPPASPEDLAVQRSEASAINVALRSLPDEERHDLVAHVVEGEPTSALAARSSATAGGIAARLARTRARMRVEYLVAARGLTLPSEQCHPVLIALSAGDRRRQRALNAAEHLVDCETCADLAPPLVERQRSLVALVPIPAIAPFLGRLWRGKRSTQATAVSAVVAVALVAAVIVATNAHSPTRRTATSSSTTTTGGSDSSAPSSSVDSGGSTTTSGAFSEVGPKTTMGSAGGAAAPANGSVVSGTDPLLPLPSAGLASFVGKGVKGVAAPVESVVADEGFWVGASPTNRLFVHLDVARESRQQVRAGQRVSFNGTMRKLAEDPAQLGLEPGEGATQLNKQGAYVVAEDLRVIS